MPQQTVTLPNIWFAERLQMFNGRHSTANMSNTAGLPSTTRTQPNNPTKPTSEFPEPPTTCRNFCSRTGLLPTAIVTAILAVGFAHSPLSAQEPIQTQETEASFSSANTIAAKGASETELAQIVQQLASSPSFEVRERAMYQLWERYTESRSQVERLAQDADPEVARRGRWILNRWEIGLLPELPWDIRRKLAGAANNPAAAFVTLIDAQRLGEASEVARMALATNSTQSAQFEQQITNIVAQRFTDLVHKALTTNSLDSLVNLLDNCAITSELAIARAVLLHRMGREVTDANILAPSTASLPNPLIIQLKVTCWTVLGDFEKAETLAKMLPNPELLSRVLTAGERWRELAALSSDCVDDELPPDATITQYATWLMAARLAGDQQQVDTVTKILMDQPGPLPLRWKALAAAGQLDAAIESAKAIDPMAAVDLLRTQMRFDEAFELLEVDPANPTPDLTKQLEATQRFFASIGSDGRPVVGDTKAFEKLSMTLELLNSVGITEPIVPTLFKLSEFTDANGDKRGLAQALTLARKINRNDLIPKLMTSFGKTNEVDLGQLPYSIISGFTNRSVTLFQRLAVAISKTHAQLSAQEQWEVFFKLAAGQLPDDWNRQSDLDALCEIMLKEAEGDRPDLLMGGSISYAIADFFLALGRSDLAEECYMRAIGPLKNPIAAMKFAKYQLASGKPESALILLDIVADHADRPIFNERYITSDPSDSVIPTPSSILLAKSIALRRLGRTEEADLIDQTLTLAPIQPRQNSGEDYLSHLIEFSELERLKSDAPFEFRRSIISDSGEQKHEHYFRFSAAAFAIDDNDPEASFRWHRMGFASTLTQLSVYARYYAIIPSTIYATEAIAAAKRGDETATEQALNNALRNYPMDISLAEDVLPKVRQSGLAQVADTTLDRILQAGKKYISQYASDASTFNNLAWVAAINGKHYEDSLILAQQAVFLEPDSVSYRDTLAEILFRMGRVDEAVSLEKQCIQDQPAHWHLHEQIERFTQPE